VPKVLIVDDEPHIMELGKLYLEREGFQVEGVGTGREALARQASSKPDLIILDLMLPDIDGFEVCKQIRAKSEPGEGAQFIVRLPFERSAS
jgi:DNA-binding response OmpR family regulator